MFELVIEAAEDDVAADYVNIGSISSVNTSYRGRFDMVTKFPRFVRGYMSSITNAVTVTLRVTR